MAALQEVEALLNRAILSVDLTNLNTEVVNGDTVPVARIGEDANLIYGVFPYPRRAVGVPGRLLTTEVTRQPVLAIQEGDRVTPLPYAEDVVKHPLKQVLVEQLEALGSNDLTNPRG